VLHACGMDSFFSNASCRIGSAETRVYLLLDVDVTRSVITEEVHMRYTVPGSYQMNLERIHSGTRLLYM